MEGGKGRHQLVRTAEEANAVGCEFPLEPVASIEMTKFKGKVICGKRAGSDFENVVRPNSATGICPEDTSPCSNSTSLWNTVCYPQQQHEAFCPITEILVTDQATGDSLKNDPSYTVVNFYTSDAKRMYLAYSKTVSDNLPITTTVLSEK